jgi:hypothetical protein
MVVMHPYLDELVTYLSRIFSMKKNRKILCHALRFCETFLSLLLLKNIFYWGPFLIQEHHKRMSPTLALFVALVACASAEFYGASMQYSYVVLMLVDHLEIKIEILDSIFLCFFVSSNEPCVS